MIKTVSTIVTTFNEESCIEACLKSLRNQKNENYKDMEIIVVDSKSEDKTAEIAERYADQTKVKKCSMPEGRNFGATIAKGEIFHFVDADVRLLDNWLDTTVPYFYNPKIVGVHGNLFPEKRNWKSCLVYWGDNVCQTSSRLVGKHVFKLGTSIVVRKNAFEKIRGYNTEFTCCEDVDFLKRLGGEGIIKYENRAMGYTSLRGFEKYGYLRRSLYWFNNAFKYLFLNKTPPKDYPR